jgi:hypothetical protein
MVKQPPTQVKWLNGEWEKLGGSCREADLAGTQPIIDHSRSCLEHTLYAPKKMAQPWNMEICRCQAAELHSDLPVTFQLGHSGVLPE